MADTNQPTKAQMWQELCEMRSQMVQLLRETNAVIAENTRAATSLQEVVRSLQKSVDLLSQQLLAAATGVPMRVFLTVVFILVAIVAAVIGLNAKDILP